MAKKEFKTMSVEVDLYKRIAAKGKFGESNTELLERLLEGVIEGKEENHDLINIGTDTTTGY